MKYFSLFSGIGGFEYGIQRSGFKNEKSRIQRAGDSQGQSKQCFNNSELGFTCVGFSEVDKYATQIYKKQFPNHKEYGDVTKINWKTVQNFDVLVGGFPCQAFSIAGKREGFDDTRGTLFFEIAKCIREKQPSLLVLENVKGLLSHDKGQTFETILRTLDELGYDVQWQVLNSKNFGVPQNRERVFIIGHLRGESRPEVFPIGETNGKDIIQFNKPTHSNDRVYGKEGLSPTLNTMQGGNRQPFIVASRGRNVDNPSDRTPAAEVEQRLEPNTQGTTNTLTSVQKDNWLMENSRIRRLTPTECERLQGFDDNFTEGISDTQRYKCLGNAVTTNVVTAIFNKIGESWKQ